MHLIDKIFSIELIHITTMSNMYTSKIMQGFLIPRSPIIDHNLIDTTIS